MQPSTNLSPEQWAEARRMRDGGASFAAIARHLDVHSSTIRRRALGEGWAGPEREKPPAAPRSTRPTRLSPATVSIRSRLALRLYRVIECKIRMMELRMMKELQLYEKADRDGALPPPVADERVSFAALIDSINQVTEMASEPATAPDGRRKSAAGSNGHAINPELTALSADIDPDGLAVASAKDNYRRELAEHLGKMFPKP
jgi:transposase-like protein